MKQSNLKNNDQNGCKSNHREDPFCNSKIHTKTASSLATSTKTQQDNENCKEISGTFNEELCLSLIKSTSEAFPKNIPQDVALQTTFRALKNLSPQDSMEGMLCSQIIALNAQGMRYLARAENDNNLLCHVESAINIAVKLLRLKNETIEKLIQYRRKGEQKVVVQHINVNDQSKAIIGDILSGGGGNV